MCTIHKTTLYIYICLKYEKHELYTFSARIKERNEKDKGTYDHRINEYLQTIYFIFD